MNGRRRSPAHWGVTLAYFVGLGIGILSPLRIPGWATVIVFVVAVGGLFVAHVLVEDGGRP